MRYLLSLFLLLLNAVPVGASWTFVDGDGAFGDASAISIATPSMTVHTGDVIAIVVSHEGTTGSPSCSDGSSTFVRPVDDTGRSPGLEPWISMHYTLSSAVNGTATYTCTFPANKTFRQVAAYIFTPSAAATTDGSPYFNSAGGTSSAPNSGNITTSGTDGMAFGGYAEFGDVLSSPKIAGNNATGSQASGRNSKIWYWPYSSGFTGAATGTTAGDSWGAGIVALQISGGAACVPTLTILGVGKC